MDDTDRMDRPSFEELEAAWQPPAYAPEPSRTCFAAPPKQRFATPAPIPPVMPQLRPQPAPPVPLGLREVAPPTARAWGFVDRVELAPTLAPTPAAELLVPAARPARNVVGAAALGAAALALVGTGALGAWLAGGGSSDDGAPRAAASSTDSDPADAEAAAAPVVEPIEQDTIPATFTSEPSGATATLVEDGQPIELGTTPAEAELDPDKTYELFVEHDGHWSDVRLITFDDGLAAAVAEHVELAPRTETEPPPAVARAQARARKMATNRRPRQAVNRTPAKGTLMLHAKPPCTIEIDGRDTGLMTPRRDIKLPPGKHQVTLVNREYDIRESLTVHIRPGRQVRVSRDLTHLL